MLNISNLSKTYPNRTNALNCVNLNIQKGVFGLLGPNGAGKSTLMRTIATLQEPSQGSILFDGIDVLREKEQVRSFLGYLPQEFGVYPTISAEDMLNHLAILKGIAGGRERKNWIERLLEMTHLTEHKKKHLGTYSGGMKQRFGIAQALIGNPRLLIVDEPTAGLDPEERDRFHNLLGSIGENTLVILSTHIVLDVSELCDDMAIIQNGTVLVQIKPEIAIQSLKGKIWKSSQRSSQEHKILSSRYLHGKKIQRIYAEKSPGPDFEPTEPNLEDVYFFYTKNLGEY